MYRIDRIICPEEAAGHLYDREIRSVFYGDRYIGLVFLSDNNENRYQLKVYDTESDKAKDFYFDMDYTDIFFGRDNFVIYNEAECQIMTMGGTEKFRHRKRGFIVQKAYVRDYRIREHIAAHQAVAVVLAYPAEVVKGDFRPEDPGVHMTAMPVRQLSVSENGYVTAVLADTDITWINTYDSSGEMIRESRTHLLRHISAGIDRQPVVPHRKRGFIVQKAYVRDYRIREHNLEPDLRDPGRYTGQEQGDRGHRGIQRKEHLPLLLPFFSLFFLFHVASDVCHGSSRLSVWYVVLLYHIILIVVKKFFPLP